MSKFAEFGLIMSRRRWDEGDGGGGGRGFIYRPVERELWKEFCRVVILGNLVEFCFVGGEMKGGGNGDGEGVYRQIGRERIMERINIFHNCRLLSSTNTT